ncbi:unnamed protein product [Allacma fusca]|uniref:ABC transporter domain-containing protein n=1 Tax=Allacma fusca TaxID=39272 RepID=A0A8J2LPQ0_9HEXA|nr:unnamed protein product [Allacma fusca]
MSSTTEAPGSKEDGKTEKVETKYQHPNYGDDESISSQEREREENKKPDVDVEVYFKTIELLKEDDVTTEETPKKSWVDRFKTRTSGNLVLVMFSRKMFFRHRSFITTFVEVFFSPLMVLGIFAAFTHGISWDKAYQEKKLYENKLRFPEAETEDIKQDFRNKYCDAGGRIFLLFYPNTTLAQRILTEVLDEFDIEDRNRFRSSKEFNCKSGDFSCTEPTGLIACESRQEILELALLHRRDRRKHMEPIGIVFDYDGKETDTGVQPIIPESMKYSIRFFSEELSQTSEKFPYVEPPRSKDKVSPYVELGFFGLQYAIEEAYLEIVDDAIREQLLDVANDSKRDLLGQGVKDGWSIVMDPNYLFIDKYHMEAWPLRIFKMYHYPNFINSNLKELIVSVVAYTMLLSYAFLTFFIVKQIVTENDSEIKTLLKLHHLPLFVHWIVLFFHAFVLRFVTALLITWFLFQDFGNGAIITRSDRVVVFLFVFFHLMSYTFFTFFLSSTFNRGALGGGTFAVLIGYLTFFIPLILKLVELMSFYPNLVAAIFLPHWAFINGIKQIIVLECEEKGMGFGTIFLSPVAGTHLSFSLATVMLLGSGLFYFSLAVFRDITKQRGLSHTHKWYQCWKAKREKDLQKQDHEEMMQDLKEHNADEVFQKPDIYEEDQRKSVLHVRNLTTLGGKHKIVLDNINLNFYHGEITIILGHTGSGKSSLIHVMGGMLIPSHGYVTINGFDVNYDRKKVREYMGYCPQKVILFNLLSVMEHVTLCYRLRGVSNSEAKKQAMGLLTLMRLWELRNKIPSELNDTSKRKLSISLALVNAPQVIFLDEPTHGLDSVSRREIWRILVELRRFHTIIIGTNRMDEAEYLGDRIALLSHGKLICYGTPKYLKSRYDTGYFLKIFPSTEKSFNLERTVKIIEKHMDEKPKQDEADEILESRGIIFELRKTKMSRYPDLFDELDKEKETLGIDEYSVEQISLFDVFIKICEAVSIEDESPDKCFRRGQPDTRRKTFDNISLPSILDHEEFKSTSSNSARALITKRLVVMRSKNKFFIWEYVVPLIIIMAVCYHANLVVEPIKDPIPLELSLNTYKNAEVFYRLGSTDVPILMNRNYKKSISRTLKHNGLRLLKTDQVLTKFEESNASRDGYVKDMHFIGIEFRQLDKLIPDEALSKNKLHKFVQFVGYYSSDALHGPPVVMNLISNVMLDAFFPISTGVQRDIKVFNEPFPEQIVSDVEAKCEVTCVLFAVIVSFALSLFVAGLIVFPLIERTTGMKHIQLMTGLHPFVYWGTEYLCDFIITLIYSFLVVGIFMVAAATLIKPIELQDVISITLIISLYLCWSSIPFTYFLSCISPNKITGYGFYVVLHVLLGLVPTLILTFDAFEKNHSNGVIFFRNILNIFPMYTITAALYRWFEADALGSECHTMPKSVKAICGTISKYDNVESRQRLYDFIIENDQDFAKCCDMVCNSMNRNQCFQSPPYFDWGKESFEEPLLIQFCIFFVLQGFLYWGLLILIDRGVIANILHNSVLKFIRTHSKNTVRSRPPDVQAEWDRCEEIIEQKTIPQDIALVCRDLTKSYATVMLVNDASIAITKGECIGVLGGGGSGKSTLVKLLCGETLATTGEVFIGDSSIHHHRVKFLSKIGYCPQNFCLFERFTPAQMLELMARLRGIPISEVNAHVDQWLTIFGLYEARLDQCKHLTYGMRRCVCAAMCLIGGSELILMDEPTSGIDPSCRQRFWTIMKLLTSNGRTVLFTSYNTEECSYLSTRMIVMCEGNIQCLGPPRELMQRFSRGFTIMLRLRHEVLSPMEIMSTTMGRVVSLKKTMKRKFKHLTLRDEQDNLLLYFLRDMRITWGELFRRMRSILDENYEIIEKYIISESTLDEIFILLTNKYRELDAPRKMEPKSAGSITQKQAEKKALKEANKGEQLDLRDKTT